MARHGKKPLVMAAVAVVSAVTMGFTAFAAYNNVGGYAKVKEGLFNLVTTEGPANYTIDLNMSITIDGSVMDGESESVHAAYVDADNYAERTGSRGNQYDTYVKSGVSFTPIDERPSYGDTSLAKWYVTNYHSNNSMFGFGGLLTGSQGVTPAQRRFMSVLMDMFAGDTKNYFTESNGHVTLNITEAQVPEIFRAGLEIANEAANRQRAERSYNDFGSYPSGSDFYGLFEEMLSDLRVEAVDFTADVDDNNTLLAADLALTFSGHDYGGAAHTVTVRGGYTMSDIGTTAVDFPDFIGDTISFNGNVFVLTQEIWNDFENGNYWNYYPDTMPTPDAYYPEDDYIGDDGYGDGTTTIFPAESFDSYEQLNVAEDSDEGGI